MIGKVASADPARGHLDHRVAGSGFSGSDVVDAHVPRSVHTNLLHEPAPSGRGLEEERHGLADPASTTSIRTPSGCGGTPSDGALGRPARRAAAGSRRPTARRWPAEIVAPEADVVQVGVLVAGPDRAGDLLDQLQVRGLTE